MKWNRFINTQGKRGSNISADLHIEHLNRICKDAVNHLGANKTPEAVKRVGKIVGIISNTLNHYDKVSGIDHGSDRHIRRSDKDDLKLVLKELCKSKVFVFLITNNCYPLLQIMNVYIKQLIVYAGKIERAVITLTG